MGTLLSRHVFFVSAVAALLAGCGGSQRLISAPGAMPQPPAIAPARTAAHRSPKSSYQQLYRFGPQIEGTHPDSGLLDVNGTLYGTTRRGGVKYGTIYSISASGVHKVLYRFHGGSDGRYPYSGLIDVNGALYGTTSGGGSSNAGTVYSVSTSGAERVLYSFKGGSDGVDPLAGLLDVNGTLYGTTLQGGGSGCLSRLGCGTVFRLTRSGRETVLHSFTGGSDGASPVAELIDVKGVLYGTTHIGGSTGGYCGNVGCGTVYSITSRGRENVLYAFQGRSDGNGPVSGLIDVNGVLYGTTEYGGRQTLVCEVEGLCGTVYSISTTGTEKVIHRFADGTDGANPVADLIAVNGVLYGTTTAGGATGYCWQPNGNCGTVYSITTAGQERVLYRFAAGTDGWYPFAPLTNVNGTLYGTTEDGGSKDVCCGTFGWGTIYALSAGRRAP